MKDYSSYSIEALEEMSKAAFSEYYKLAVKPCTNPTKADLAPLEKATAKYETIREEIERRL